jgi:hypothetical protein
MYENKKTRELSVAFVIDRHCHDRCLEPIIHVIKFDMTADSADVIICGLIAVAVYMFLASLFEQKKVRFIHETGVAIIIGFLVGLFVYFLFNTYFQRLVKNTCNLGQLQ